MAQSSSAPALCFGTTTFHPINLDGQIWLRLPQIGVALSYQSPYKLQQVYERNAAEFTEHMTRVVKLPDLIPQSEATGQLRDVRIFSLRGAHLLGMLARTARAAEFRRWVLDVLDRTAATSNATTPPAEELERSDYRSQASALAMQHVQALMAGQKPSWPEAQARLLADGIVHAWLLRDARWLMSFDSTGRLQLQRLEPGQHLVDALSSEALRSFALHAVPAQRLPDLAYAAVEALAQARGPAA